MPHPEGILEDCRAVEDNSNDKQLFRDQLRIQMFTRMSGA